MERKDFSINWHWTLGCCDRKDAHTNLIKLSNYKKKWFIQFIGLNEVTIVIGLCFALNDICILLF